MGTWVTFNSTMFPPDEASRRKQLHNLRESFRRSHFERFLKSSRREATFYNAQGVRYNEEKCRLARKVCQSRKAFHLMSGATVSPAAFAAMKRAAVPRRCPWCGAEYVPTAQHVAWECEGVKEARQRHLGDRGGEITNHLQKRLGWPTGHRLDLAVLEWLIEVRDLFLRDRYA